MNSWVDDVEYALVLLRSSEQEQRRGVLEQLESLFQAIPRSDSTSESTRAAVVAAIDFALPILLGESEEVESRLATTRVLGALLQTRSVLQPEDSEKIRRALYKVIEDDREITRVQDACERILVTFTQGLDKPKPTHQDLPVKEEPITLNCSIVEDYLRAESAINEHREEIRLMLERVINGHQGYRPASIKEGQALAQFINEIAAEHGLRVAYGDTDEPATLSFRWVGKAKDGAFTVRKDASTSKYEGKALPAVRLVPAKPSGHRPFPVSVREKFRASLDPQNNER